MKKDLYKDYKDGKFKKIGSVKLPWEGKNIPFDVVELNINELKYNVLNGRIAELDLNSKVELNEATYENIKQSIVASSKKDIEKLAKDIEKSGLKTPLIVNSEGIIIDGNRRYTAISMLLAGEIKPFSEADVINLETIDAVILDASTDDISIKILEYKIQYDDMKRAYDPVSRAFDFARSHKQKGMSVKAIADATGIKVTEIKKDIRTVDLIRVYLAAIGENNNILLAQQLKLDGPMKEIAATKKKTDYFLNNQKELVELITMAKAGGGDITRDVRDFVKGVGQGKNKKTLLDSPEIKKGFKKIVNESAIPERIKKAARAETASEKAKIITTPIKDMDRKIHNCLNEMFVVQKNKKNSDDIQEFLKLLKNLDFKTLSNKDLENLEKIVKEINGKKL